MVSKASTFFIKVQRCGDVPAAAAQVEADDAVDKLFWELATRRKEKSYLP
jgi:hypothetical protein